MLAKRYGAQLDAYYRLPQEQWTRKEIRFSPSMAGNCSRQIFYDLTNVPKAEQSREPFQARIPRVGDGIHFYNQEDALKIPDALREHGQQPQWRVKTLDNGKPAIEAKYRKTFHVEGVDITISGRLDAIIEFTDSEGNVECDAIVDYKSKTMLKKLAPSSIVKEIDKYRSQMVCYTLLTDIPDVLIQFESAQKPAWGDGSDAKPDVRNVYLRPTDEERDALLAKFASIVRAIRDDVVPAAETSYACIFCPFQQRCKEDGETAEK